VPRLKEEKERAAREDFISAGYFAPESGLLFNVVASFIFPFSFLSHGKEAGEGEEKRVSVRLLRNHAERRGRIDVDLAFNLAQIERQRERETLAE